MSWVESMACMSSVMEPGVTLKYLPQEKHADVQWSQAVKLLVEHYTWNTQNEKALQHFSEALV